MIKLIKSTFYKEKETKRRLSKFIEVLLLFILSLTPLLWFKDDQIILGHDSGFRLNPLRYWISLLYSWNPILGFGFDWSQFKGFLVTQFPETFFALITGSLAAGQKFTFIFWFFVIGISMYIFINSFFPARKFLGFRILGSVFYIYNFFLLQGWFIVERAKFSNYAVLPLGLLIIYKTLTKKYSLLKGAVLLSLVHFLLNGGGAPTLFGALVVVYILTFIYLTIINIFQKGFKELLYSFKVAAFFLIGFLLVNAYWVLPHLYLLISSYGSSLAGVGGVNGILDWEATISKNASLINLLRLQGIPDWYDNPSHTYATDYLQNPYLIVLSFIFLAFSLAGFVLREKFKKEERHDKLFFLIFIFLIVGLIFTAGSHQPFGFIYTFFVKYVPGFPIFRSSFYKFAPTVWFSLIFLFSYSVSFISLRYIKNKTLYVIFGTFAVGFILVYHHPFFSGNFFLWQKPFSTKVSLPKYAYEMSKYIDDKTTKLSRILLMPPLDSVDSYKWGYWSPDPFLELSTDRSIIGRDALSFGIPQKIYKTVGEGSEEEFLYITGIYGINKILWRDDVLYSDKKTTSTEYAYLKEKLDSFASVELEKKFGEWSLYDISSPNYKPLFYSPSTLIDSNLTIEPFLYDAYRIERSTIVASPNGDNLINNENSYTNHKFIKVACIFCKEIIGQNAVSFGNTVSPARFLPDSIIYPLISLKEKITASSAKGQPGKLIDAFISFSSKRLGEIIEMSTEMKNKNKEYFMEQGIKKYKNNISDALSQVEDITGSERDYYYARIFSFLEGQRNFIASPVIEQKIKKEVATDLVSFIDTQKNFVSKNAWITTSHRNIKYQFSLNVDGEYDVHLTNLRDYPKQIILDGKRLNETKGVFLESGLHRIELFYPEEDNLLDNSGSNTDGAFNLGQNEAYEYGIKDFDSKSIYSISFEYKLNDGNPPAISIFQRANDSDNGLGVFGKILYVNYNGLWNKFHYVFHPYSGLPIEKIEFTSVGLPNEFSNFDVKDFVISRVNIPDIVLSKTTNTKDLPTPRITFEKINPTKYTVHIENAQDKYTLVFGEAYKKDWKAYVIDEKGKKIAIMEEKHNMINGYANGWFIDKKGTYDIVVEYWPQQFAYIGIAISILTLAVYFLIFGIFRIKRYYGK